MNNNYKMNNDTMTLFLATSILAIGGIGIYMFNTNDKPTKGRRNKKVEPVDDSESDEESQATEPEPELEPEEEEENNEDDQYVSKSRGSKTKKSRKSTKGTKRRY